LLIFVGYGTIRDRHGPAVPYEQEKLGFDSGLRRVVRETPILKAPEAGAEIRATAESGDLGLTVFDFNPQFLADEEAPGEESPFEVCIFFTARLPATKGWVRRGSLVRPEVGSLGEGLRLLGNVLLVSVHPATLKAAGIDLAVGTVLTLLTSLFVRRARRRHYLVASISLYSMASSLLRYILFPLGAVVPTVAMLVEMPSLALGAFIEERIYRFVERRLGIDVEGYP
jgi:hypothetical protein